jgi:hypothetical protein
MEQLIEEVSRELDKAQNNYPASSHRTSGLNSNESLAENQSEREHPPPAEDAGTKTAAMSSESHSSSSRDQSSIDSNSPLPTKVDIAMANTSDAAFTPTSTPIENKIALPPAARYLTHKQTDAIGDQDVPVFGWFVTSPEGNKTWMYIT